MGFDLGGGGGEAFPFENVGDIVTGKILKIEEVQSTDLDTGELAFWANGQPRMITRVELQTELRDADTPTDQGKRSIYLKGSRKAESQSSMAAVIQAVQRATGSTEIDYGGTLTVRYTGNGQRSRPGLNPPKQYAAEYTPPRADLGGQQAAPPPAPQANPWPPAAPQQAPTPPAAPQFNPWPPAAPQQQQAAPAPQAGIRGWLDGKPITAETMAAFQAAGIDPANLPGYQPAQPGA